jgi:hypothetical protein
MMAAATSTLDTIRQKVRRLTRNPSEASLSTSDIDQYVNTFILYDFPQHLRLFDLHTTLTFFTQPFIDTYSTNTTDPTNPLFDFKNKYISVLQPIYIAGYKVWYSESREQFFNVYPMINSISQQGAGDGITTTFIGNVTNNGNPTSAFNASPNFILRNNVTFSSIDSNSVGLELHDDGFGNLIGDGTGTINYETGAFTLTYTNPPGAGIAVNSMTVPYVPSLPQAMCYFNDTFILRPVPDQPYRVNLEVFIQPTQLLQNTDNPDINEWWQYYAYGAAKKVFEDRMDTESIQQIMPEFKKQELLVLRKTIVQQTSSRTSTIYTEQVGNNGGSGTGWGFGGGNF